MQFNNLDINILYVLCRSTHDRISEGSVRTADLDRAFSDIPEDDMHAVIGSMEEQKLIALDASRARVSITPYGIQRFQGSIACKIHQFEGCNCTLGQGR